MSPEINTLLSGFITSPEAGKRFGITHDYVGVLCRRKKVAAMFVGRAWFVEEASLRAYLNRMDIERERRHEALSQAFSHEK